MKYLLSIFFLLFSISSVGEENIIEKRIYLFKKADNSMVKIKKLIQLKNYGKIVLEANIINKWSENIPSLFPIGTQASMTNNSDASENIWTSFNDFTSKANKTEFYSKLMVKSANEKNLDALLKAFRETSKSCNSCHVIFRN